MRGGATAGKDENTINILMDPAAKKDEGDFGSIDLVLGLSRAANMPGKDKTKTEMQSLVEQFETFFAIMSEQGDKADKGNFTWKYYMPYFNAMKQKGHVEPFVYYIHRSSDNEEVMQWLTVNRAKVVAFVTWSKGYVGPNPD